MAPGLAMDYRIWVEAGKEECFYQYVQPGAQFYVSFHTLRGGDGMTGFAVRDPTGQLVHPYQWKKQSEYETTSETGGYFTSCIDNQFSRFAGKLVNMYLTTFRYDEWEKHSEELEQYDIVATNFTNGLGLVDHKVQISKQYLSHSRSRAASDWELLISNNAYVMRWSLIQVVVVVATGCLQVFFVRKLFDTHTKPRGRI
ncbi:transmembrane emp24 domain-containing protein 1-like [Pollicipes pollicipes]|nr:transmembrane emp24 domain-containing protein 1-like [Pollicipes pollicipes]